jgi:hypothetical protein
MKTHAFVAGVMSVVLALPVAVQAQAQAPAAPVPARSRAAAVPMPKPCPVGADCRTYAHLLSFPANALSYSPSSAFARQTRGVAWLAKPGAMTLTVHRPKDFPAGGKVRITVFHQVTNDAEGTITFNIEPMAFDSGDSFETYGAQSTNTVAAPGNPTTLLQQSLLLSPGNGWNPDRDWWYIEITRQGTFNGSLRLMSVAIDY